MPDLSRVVGQDRAVGALRRAIQADRLPGGFLFAGPDGVGKATAAVALARALDCDDGNSASCAPCHACDRIERDIHPLARAEIEKQELRERKTRAKLDDAPRNRN